MVSLSYVDTRPRGRASRLHRKATWLDVFNWRLSLALILNVALWTGVAKLLDATA